jgi:uncharacterized protein
MSLPFTNTHMHVFNSPCAPDRFLMIIPNNFLRSKPALVKKMIDSGLGRWVITKWFGLTKNKNGAEQKKLDKYLAFLDVGTDSTQQEVFETALHIGQQADPSVRIVGLTMNMDFMDSEPSQNMISYETQLEQVKSIKRYYPLNFFPFLGVDPRHKSGQSLVDWAKTYFESGVVTDATVFPYFCGIKFYPALGFFPFDPRLAPLFEYAQANDLPVMTHCTRSGSQYIGDFIEALIPLQPQMILPELPDNEVMAVRNSIWNRISRYYDLPTGKDTWIQNNNRGNNDLACDLFGHPENYIPLLKAYPNLKICLAHLGGSSEIYCSDPKELASLRSIWKRDGYNWFDKIRDMMIEFPNLYTDISYTVSDFSVKEVWDKVYDFLICKDKNGDTLSCRVLFGTDFFMTEQEKPESELYMVAASRMGPAMMNQIARINPQKFLRQPVL